MRRMVGAAAAGVVVAASLLATAAPASAVTYDEATWYYTNLNMAANLAVANGTGISIALLDGSIDPKVPELANAKIQTQPSQCLLNGSADPVTSTTDATHGTQMAVMIAGNGTGNWNGQGGKGVAPGATILHYRNSTVKPDGDGVQCLNAQGTDVFDEATADAVTDAVAKGARVVNMSFGTDAAMPLTTEALGEAQRQGVVFVGATDDDDDSRDPERLGHPVDVNGVVAVNALTPDSKPAPYSSTSDVVTVLAPGETICSGGFNPSTGAWDSAGVSNGSSAAAAFTSAVLADAMSRYPDATGNQIVQLMLRTTGGTFHEVPSRTTDGFGFGTVSLTTMYEHDPGSLPDVNPLLRDGAEPSTAEILGTSTESPSSDSPSPDPSTSAAPSSPRPQAVARDGGSSLPLLLGIGAGVVVLLGVVVALVVVVLARRRRGQGPPPPPVYGGSA